MGEKEPSELVLPFGKHKGLTVAELLSHDPPYVEWLLGQAWLADRFAAIHAAILTRGAGTDDSPEHNVIQARFLDPVFQEAFLRLAAGREVATAFSVVQRSFYEPSRKTLKECKRVLESTWSGEESKEKARTDMLAAQEVLRQPSSPVELRTQVEFEVQGVDVVLHWNAVCTPEWNWTGGVERVEIKPSLGDDFPSVMRQMKRLDVHTLVIDRFSGRSVPLADVRRMFEASRMQVFDLMDIEAAMKEITG